MTAMLKFIQSTVSLEQPDSKLYRNYLMLPQLLNMLKKKVHSLRIRGKFYSFTFL